MLTFSVIGPAFRKLGQSLNVTGLNLQGDLTSDDRAVPSLRCKPYKHKFPSLRGANFVAPNSTVVGDVAIGQDTSIWYGAVLRGDRNSIKVGKSSIIQDLAVIHPSSQQVEIGDNAFVGPNTVLDSCKVESKGFVGMGATVHSGAKVESYGVVAAGSVIPENTTVPSYQIWAGNPARYLRDLTNEEKEVLDEFHSELVSLAKVHSEETEKSSRQVIDDLDEKETEKFYSPEDWAIVKAKELGFPVEYEDEDFVEQRVFMREHEPSEELYWKKNYDPYEQDLYHFPDSFKIYGENYEKYEQLKKYFEENPTAQVQQMEREKRIPNRDDSAWTRKF